MAIQFIKVEGDLINIGEVVRIRPLEHGVEFDMRDEGKIPMQYYHTTFEEVEEMIRGLENFSPNNLQS